MVLFDTVFADDDLMVLSAYVQAQESAEAARKLQSREPDLSVDPIQESDEVDGEAADDGEDEEQVVGGSGSAPRRTYTWISRLCEVEGVPPDRMAPIHGRLIAHGLLQFQLQGRDEGVVYRVTSAGRQMLIRPEAQAGAEAA